MNIHIGIDIGGTWTKFGAIDADGHILYADRAKTHGSEGQKATLAGIVDCSRHAMDWATHAGHDPVSIGIGSPGTINPVTRKVQPPTPNLTTIIGVDLAGVVEQDTGLPTAIDNDANCAAWAEHRYGAGRGIDDLICVTVGSGIGSGFIVDGRIFSGPHGSGSEMGHLTIDWRGPRCPCGNNGCLELYASANAMLKKAQESALLDPKGRLAQAWEKSGEMTLSELFMAARGNDNESRRILAETAQQLALGIINAVNLFDPDVVIIGGGAADADTDGVWLGDIAERMHNHAFSVEGKALPVGKAALGNDAGFIGAAALGAMLLGKSD